MRSQDTKTTERRAIKAFGNLPLAFVRNAGQSEPRVRYLAQASGASFGFTPRNARFAFNKDGKGLMLELRFLGTSGTEPQGARPLPGRVNYLRGSEPGKWRTDLPTYSEVVYRELWPGIDLAFRAQSGVLKYEFRVSPGADVSDIRLGYRGAERLALGRAGDLSIHTSLGGLRDSRPVSYQTIDGRRVPVESRFALARTGGAYGFALERYDRAHPLVIDPGLAYSTFLGGMQAERGFGIAVDAPGNAYITGNTESTGFPATPGAFDPTFNGGTQTQTQDAFVTKLNTTGSALVYSTFLGGTQVDEGKAIAVDASGNAHVTGVTVSADFPTTTGAFDSTHNGSGDAFVTKLNATGSGLVYSTFLGGTQFEEGGGIVIDSGGNALVSGYTGSADLPTTPGAFDPTINGGGDAFVTKLDVAGSALVYSTFLGGTQGEEGRRIAVDPAGNAFVTGFTASTDYPTTPGAFDSSFAGGLDAFVTKLNVAGSALVYSTFLGGSQFDAGLGIAVDAAGNAAATGYTVSADFPTTAGAFDSTHNGSGDAFVTKLNATGSGLVYSTFLGGTQFEQGGEIALDPAGVAFVTGITGSADFPTTPGAFDSTYNGSDDAFVTKLNATGSALVYSTFLGGTQLDHGFALAVDAAGAAYVTGYTTSADFPTTPGAFDTTYNGNTDAFVTKLDLIPGPPPGPATVTLSPASDTNPVGTSHTVTATVQDATGQPVGGVVVQFTVTGSVSVSGQCTTDASGQCSFTYQGPAVPGSDSIQAFADTDGDGTQDAGEPSGTASKTWVAAPPCEKQAVQDVLNPSTGRFPGNGGPDVLVRTDLGQSVQNAVDTATDVNSDGYLIVAVVNNGSGQLGGSSTQSVVVSRNYGQTFALIGCSVTLNDPTPTDANPTIWIQSGANSPGNIFLMDLHGAGSSAAGILVSGDGRYLRNEYALNNAVGFKVLGNGNTIHNGQGTGNSGDGVYVQGDANVLTDVDAYSNGGNGFHVVGNNNQLLKLDAGDKNKRNSGDGIHVVGNGNLVSEASAFANNGDGVDIAGASNTVTKAVAGDSGKGNGQDGIHIAGAGNNINQSKASSNGDNGYDLSGGSAASPNKLQKDLSNTGPSGNANLENTGPEYRFLNSIRNNGGENKADSITVPKTSSPTKCTAFPATNVTATFAAVSTCE